MTLNLPQVPNSLLDVAPHAGLHQLYDAGGLCLLLRAPRDGELLPLVSLSLDHHPPPLPPAQEVASVLGHREAHQSPRVHVDQENLRVTKLYLWLAHRLVADYSCLARERRGRSCHW